VQPGLGAEDEPPHDRRDHEREIDERRLLEQVTAVLGTLRGRG